MFEDYRRMEIEDIPAPTAGTGEAVVEVAACGICGSDLEGYLATPGMKERRVPPLLLGHEFSGVVTGDVEAWAGVRVAVNPLITCGVCMFCRGGRRHLCPERSLIGLNRPGAFAERVAVPVRNLVALPEGLPAWKGALAEPLAVAGHGVELAGPLLERSVTVFGGGAIGFLAAFLARRAGGRVTVVDISDERRAQLESMEFATSASPEEETDVAIDTVGLEITRRQAVAHLVPGGTAVFLGLHDDEGSFSFYPVVLQERRIQGSYCYTDLDFERAVALAGDVPEEFFERQPLEAGGRAFADLAGGKVQRPKVLLQPAG
jgi:threonine dehydrogenase-like Zn-dependent dehydrogenase